MSEMTYDEKCHDLAIYFLRDYDLSVERERSLAHELAQRIQAAIEDFEAGEGL